MLKYLLHELFTCFLKRCEVLKFREDAMVLTVGLRGMCLWVMWLVGGGGWWVGWWLREEVAWRLVSR